MNILKTITRKIFTLIFIFVFTINTLVYAQNYNPPREELEEKIEEVAAKRAIPSVILKAIARVESVYEHYNSDGSPKITGSSIGLMQINNRYGGYDTEKLKYDIMYNIEAGADVLLNKWSMSSYQTVSSVGNMDPNIIENWYFALWAYNGWAQSNNPNMLSSYAKKYTYQGLIYYIIEKEYGQKINSIDFSYLPKSGKPSRSLVVPTPSYTNCANIILYDKDDYVRTDGVREKYYLRDAPAGRYIHELQENQLGIIKEGPILQNGYYWYKVYIDDNTEGWIERNLLTRTGDTECGRYVFDDIAYHWARKDIMKLYKHGVINEAESFNPDDVQTKDEFLALLEKALEYKNKSIDKPNKEDTNKIEKKEATGLEETKNTDVMQDALNSAKENKALSRIEAAKLIQNIFEDNKEFENLDIKTIFLDLENLNDEETMAVKSSYINGIISGKKTKAFCPDDILTKAEASAIIAKIIDKIENIKN